MSRTSEDRFNGSQQEKFQPLIPDSNQDDPEPNPDHPLSSQRLSDEHADRLTEEGRDMAAATAKLYGALYEELAASDQQFKALTLDSSSGNSSPTDIRHKMGAWNFICFILCSRVYTIW